MYMHACVWVYDFKIRSRSLKSVRLDRNIPLVEVQNLGFLCVCFVVVVVVFGGEGAMSLRKCKQFNFNMDILSA